MSKPWTDLRAALDELLVLPREQRDHWLAKLAGRDPDLHAAVVEMLEHDAAAAGRPGFLEPPASARSRADALIQGLPGHGRAPMEHLGAYEVLRPLGRGGMGVVYLARRADGAYERRVAIKVLHASDANERVLERFQRERQVLANLEHPGIARMIEGGTTESGQPYLVMEYVDGISLERYCDEQRLSVTDRIQILLQVCDAVQHAHSHLVVHRDLKPQNILVTARGVPKLLDFGIAKVLDPEKTSSRPDVTLDLMRMMTPAYASPEQVAGRTITTASDVYSLGVILYQLLTGELPYVVPTTSAVEAERVVCNTDPRRPSDTVIESGDDAVARAHLRMSTPRSLIRCLRGDLDQIVLKALRKESRLRYASVREFAEDLRAHLAGMPVSAHADSLLYRASRFGRRHRAAVSAAVAITVALVVGLVLALAQYQRAEVLAAEEGRQRSIAEARLGETQELAGALSLERQRAEARLLEVERLNTEVEAQRRIAERRYEEVHRFATKLIFDVYGAVESLAGGAKVGGYVVELGLEHLDRLSVEAANASGDGQLHRELAHAYMRLAETQLAMSRSESAVATADKAIAMARGAITIDASDPRNVMTVAATLVSRANVHFELGQQDLALSGYREALALAGPLAAAKDAKFGLLSTAYTASCRLAQALLSRKEPGEILAYLRESERLLQRIVTGWPSDARVAELAYLRLTVADVENAAGEQAAARERLGLALPVLESFASKHPADRDLARKLRLGRTLRAGLAADDGDPATALQLLEANRTELLRIVREPSADAKSRTDLLWNTEATMGILLRGDGDPAAALDLADADLEVARTANQSDPEHGRARMALGRLLRRRGECLRRLRSTLAAAVSLTEAASILTGLVREAPDFAEACRELVLAHAELARTHRDAARDAADPVLVGRALASAVDHWQQALQHRQRLAEMHADTLLHATPDFVAESAEAQAALRRTGERGGTAGTDLPHPAPITPSR